VRVCACVSVRLYIFFTKIHKVKFDLADSFHSGVSER